ncbi:MAG: class I SAM-dependent methyltransferase, partial [Rhodothermales bacterium]
IIQDLYSPAYTDYQADLVSCRHVLEHIQTPRAFVQTVRQSIGDQTGTAVFFEVPNVLFTLRELAIWDLIYEHCSYFSPLSLRYLFRENGFTVRRTDEAFGGQYLTLEAYPGQTSEDVADGEAAELDVLRNDVADFAQRYEEKVAAWNRKLAAARQASERVVIWGSGSKGVTILNVLEARDQIEYAVDINPRKQGKHVAGTGQQIVPPAFLKTYQPDVIILMNAIYESEVRQTAKELGLDPRFEIA